MNETKAQIIVKEIIQKLEPSNEKPSLFVSEIYDYYKENYTNTNTLNGSIFEEVIIQCLLRNEIEPIYAQAKMSFVPNVIFDIVLYNKTKPVVLSIKTTLRERWKQADLEAVAMKYVYRNSKNYLINYSEKETDRRKKDSNGYMGLDDFIYAGSEKFDELISELSTMEFVPNEDIPVFSNYKEYTNENKY